MQERKNIKKPLSIYFGLLILLALFELYVHFDVLNFGYLMVVVFCFSKFLIIVNKEEK